MTDPSLMMSPSLQGLIDDASPAPTADIRCVLQADGCSVEGRLVSFVDAGEGAFDVTVEASIISTQDALRVTRFLGVVITMDGLPMLSRDIQHGWSQRKEVKPRGQLLMLNLVVRKGQEQGDR